MRDSMDRFACEAQGGLTGRHVLISFCAFFGIIFAVNGYFLFAALGTHTGVVAVEPYRKGLAYNDRIAASDRQMARGWTDMVSTMPDGTVAVVISDASGAAVPGLKLNGTIGRPSTAREDVTLAFNETADGRYLARTPPLAAGTWVITLETNNGSAGLDYKTRRRLWLER